MKQSGGHYPAPFKIIEATKVGLEKGLVAGYEAEAKVCALETAEKKNFEDAT